MDDQQSAALVAALVLAAVHLYAGTMRLLAGVPRNAWLSAFGGISVAYVFVHLLPELAEGQAAIEGEDSGEVATAPLLGFLEHHVYLMALLGLIVFYAVEQRSLASRREQHARAGEDRTEGQVFWLSIASFAVYNAIVGYLLLRGDLGELSALALYTSALVVHFVVNDFSLREHHKDAYEHAGRWIIALAVLAGWLVGVITHVPERAIALLVAFIAGGIVLNVLKEELPGERRARLAPFLGGAVLYTCLLQLA